MAELNTEYVQSSHIACPKCGALVPLTEALAAPLIAAARAEDALMLRTQHDALEAERKRLANESAFAKKRDEGIAERESALEQAAKKAEAERSSEREGMAAEIARQTSLAVDRQLADRLVIERELIAEQEERRARQRTANELAERKRDVEEQAAQLEELTSKLADARKGEAELKRREREFEEIKRELPLTIEKEVSGRLDQVRAVATNEAEQRFSLELSDKDRVIRDLGNKLEEASRKAKQSSQQAQGETLELLLEDQLRRQFPYDELIPVPKGQNGGDTVHVVKDSSGRECGRILWEFKRTKQWKAEWLPKLRIDQRAAKADLAVVVSQAMPPDVQHFNEVDGVWVSSLSCTLPIASALRSTLLLLAGQRRNAEGQQTKSELVYAYLTGSLFRGRIEAISERWTEMQNDLAEEKKSTLKRWSKREMQLQTLLASTAGIYGDVQGIVGRDIAEIDALGETLLLEG